MVKFIAGVLEQLDLALEHISKGEVHNARFGLMMTDNALELVFHRLAKDKDRELRSWRNKIDEYQQRDALAAAQGQKFSAKVRFARIEGIIDEETADTILNLHGFRNQLYHAGLQHEAILPELAAFYLDVACRTLAKHRIRSMSYSSVTRIPDRARKYMSVSKAGRLTPDFSDFEKGCRQIAEKLSFDSRVMIASLRAHLDQLIDYFDTCLRIAADGVYEGQQMSRDQAVIRSQVWPVLFSEEGKRFAVANGWSGKTFWEFESWMTERYPLEWNKDPVPSWKRRAVKMRTNLNPHSSLKNYARFIKETEDVRDSVSEAAGAAEAEIDRLIDERRGK